MNSTIVVTTRAKPLETRAGRTRVEKTPQHRIQPTSTKNVFFFFNEHLFTGNAIKIVDIKLYRTDLEFVVSDSHMHI